MNGIPNIWIYLLFVAPILPVGLMILIDAVAANRGPGGAAASV
jgi:hypothetical protein